MHETYRDIARPRVVHLCTCHRHEQMADLGDASGARVQEDEDDDEDGLMASVGFMFDAEHAKEVQQLQITPDVKLSIKTIGDQPGHKQSGQYLWPAAKAAAQYLLSHWGGDLEADTVLELGAGCGVAGLSLCTCPSIRHLVFSDYDRGTLSLIEDSVELNKARLSRSLASITTSNLEWGKVAHSLSLSPPNVRQFSACSEENTFRFSTDSRFSLIVGTDLIYCKDVVLPLFSTVKHFLAAANHKHERQSRFVLVTSFVLGSVCISFTIDCLCLLWFICLCSGY
jgi:predicted nicotinamide N-methyase